MKDYSLVAVSSKVKFLRNLNGFKFLPSFEGDEGVKVLNKIADAALSLDEEFKIYKLDNLEEMDINLMLEKNLITNNLIENKSCSAVLLSSGEDVSIMINESDHISLSCQFGGLNLLNCYDRINAIDNSLLSKLDIAYDDSIGFLTTNISNVGTGMISSISLFLPALTILGKIREIASSLVGQGFEFAPVLDSELKPHTFLYSLSNIQTIGRKETDYIVKLSEFAIKICELELSGRKTLLQLNNIDDTKDKVFRAWGLITNCYKISPREAEECLADIKLGVALDLIRFNSSEFLNSLATDILPYSLTKISGGKVTVAELDKYRAKFLSNVLKSKRIK